MFLKQSDNNYQTQKWERKKLSQKWKKEKVLQEDDKWRKKHKINLLADSFQQNYKNIFLVYDRTILSIRIKTYLLFPHLCHTTIKKWKPKTSLTGQKG